MTTWTDKDTGLKRFTNTPSNHPPGYKLKRPLWCKLNIIRSSAGRFNGKMNQLGYRDDPVCACGGQPIFQVPDIHRKCFQLIVENIHIIITFELPSEKVFADMLATEHSVCVRRPLATMLPVRFFFTDVP